jgi:hypothetical protein
MSTKMNSTRGAQLHNSIICPNEYTGIILLSVVILRDIIQPYMYPLICVS